MPELPEVEAARTALEHAVGRTVARVDDRDEWVCRPHRPGEIAAVLEGGRLTAAHRIGKTLWCDTATDDAPAGPALGLHLGMGGRIVVTDHTGAPVGEGPAPSDRRPGAARWNRFTVTFDDGGELRLVDKRRLGRVRLDPDLSGLGPDAEGIAPAEFRGRLARGRSTVKARLLDQSVIAGVGNLLADETLWQARIDPRRRVPDLTRTDLDRVHRHLGRALSRAVAHGGVHTGEVIEHRRPGGHCPRCGAELTHATVGAGRPGGARGSRAENATVHNRPVPDESDTALLYVDRGLVRADDGPPDQRAQRRAQARARAARRVRWAVPAALLLLLLAVWPVGSAALVWFALAVLLAAGVAVVVLTRAARVAHAVAGLPVPIEITGKVATALRSVLAMTRGIAGQRALRRSGAAAEGMRVLRDWSAATEGLRTAWLRGDVAAWHEQARTLADTGARADRVRADLESAPGGSGPGDGDPGSSGPGGSGPGSDGPRDDGPGGRGPGDGGTRDSGT